MSVHTVAVQAADLPLKRLIAIVVAVGLALVTAGLASNTDQLWFAPPIVEQPDRAEGESLGTIESSGTAGRTERSVEQSRPLPGWIAAAILVIVFAILIYLALQHGPRVSLPQLGRHRLAKADKPPAELDDEAHADEIIRVTTDLIDDLSLEGDPRAAIQRAYAAVETGFGSRELARKPAETPLRYLERVFGRRMDQAGPLQQLTRLFETARFSTQPITEDMRTEAIDAVAAIRTHYRSRRRGLVR